MSIVIFNVLLMAVVLFCKSMMVFMFLKQNMTLLEEENKTVEELIITDNSQILIEGNPSSIQLLYYLDFYMLRISVVEFYSLYG